MSLVNSSGGGTAQRVMVATVRKNKKKTVVLHDELAPLRQGEIRLRVDKVGLSANNMFYAQMGEAPFLKFFSVYPIDDPLLANVPAWGVATIIASANSDFAVGEQFRGFLHIANVVQMQAKRTSEGFTACGGNRAKLNKAYNGFIKVEAASPFHGVGSKPDLAAIAAPGALSGFLLCELLRTKHFYNGDSILLTSASSKLSLATAFLLQPERSLGTLKKIIGYSSSANQEFVRSTGLFDEVLTYEEALPAGVRPVLIDVAGDATIYRRAKDSLAKALAVGGTHANAKASTFAAFGPSGLFKLVSSMVAPAAAQGWVEENVHPPLEMFFAPTVMTQLVERWGAETLGTKADEALGAFVDAAVDGGWLQVVRSEEPAGAQSEYERIALGTVPPSEAIVLSLS